MWNDKGLPIWTGEGTIRTKISLSAWKIQPLLCESRNNFTFCRKSLHSLDVYKLHACSETGFVSFHWISTCVTFGLFSLFCFSCLNRSLGAWLQNLLAWKEKKKCEGCTTGNYYKLIQSIVILEGLEWSEINYSFYSTKCEFILDRELASLVSTYKDANILHCTCRIPSCHLPFLSLSEILNNIWFVDSILKLRCQRNWDLGVVLFWCLFQLWSGLDTKEVFLHLLNIIWSRNENILLLCQLNLSYVYIT